MNSENKKTLILATHSGSFHADDVFATATLSLFLDQKNINYTVIRTRDEALLNKADYVYDVGRVYDHTLKRYDHHQVGNAGMRENKVPYAAFGLVWKHYGLSLCGQNQEVWQSIDESWAQPIDATDNGVVTYSVGDLGVRPITIQSVIHLLVQEGSHDEQFFEAVKLAKKLLKNTIGQSLKTRIIVGSVLKEFETQKDKKIIIFDANNIETMFIWQALVDNEEAKDVLYTIHKNSTKPGWKLIAMRKGFESFDSRLPLPKNLGGISAKELQKELGFAGVDFVHTTGFLAATQTKESAVKLAEYVLGRHTIT